MQPSTGITLIKQFSYRGDAFEQWSNTYWFQEPAPNNALEWDSVWVELWNIESLAIPLNSKLVQVYGYDDRTYGSHAVFDHLVEPGLAGQFPVPPSGIDFAGDQAAMVGWKTLRKTNPGGKWIYLRKYLHDGFVKSVSPDFLEDSYFAALNTYAGQIQSFRGGLVAAPSKDDPTPPIDTIQSIRVPDYVTTRSLKRRGKRPVPKAPAGLV